MLKILLYFYAEVRAENQRPVITRNSTHMSVSSSTRGLFWLTKYSTTSTFYGVVPI
jgi:hypothetical protein